MFQTLVADNAQWQTLIADDLVWELVYAPSIGHPARLSGRAEVMRHVTWFLEAVENFRFFDLRVYPFADPDAAAAEVRAEALDQANGADLSPRSMRSSCARKTARSRTCVSTSIRCVRRKQ